VPKTVICIALKSQAIEQLLIDLFFNLSDPVPGRIFVDMDVTDDPVHDNKSKPSSMATTTTSAMLLVDFFVVITLQPNSALVMWTQQRERGVTTDCPSDSTTPKTQIIVRGDSAYARDESMSWCEEHNNVLGLSNQRLQPPMSWKAKPKLNSNAVKPLRLHCDPHPGFVPSPTAP